MKFRVSRRTFLAVVSVLCLAGCGGIRVEVPKPPKNAEQALKEAECTRQFLRDFDAAKLSACMQNATTTATATPTRVSTATPTATSTPHPTATQASPTVIWVEPSKCYGSPRHNPEAPKAAFRQLVIEAFDRYCPTFPFNCNPEGRRVKDGYQDHFYDEMVAYLQQHNTEAWVDVCGGSGRCGEIQVAPGGTKFGTGWSEGYHVLISPGEGAKPPNVYWNFDTEGFTGRCEPKWWTSKADWESSTTPNATAQPSPTPTKAATLSPPVLTYFNGCTDGSGHCEFAQWFDQFRIPPDHPQPLCAYEQCPVFWRAPGMALTCDHMFAEEKDGGMFDARAGRFVTIMWYVCGGRKWDDPRGPELITTYPAHCDQPGFRNRDLFNAKCYGPGTVKVCARADAYACVNQADYLNDETYSTKRPINSDRCESGTIPLPVVERCVGPFEVR